MKSGCSARACFNIVSYLIQLFQYQDQNAEWRKTVLSAQCNACPNIVSSGMEVTPLLFTSNMTTTFDDCDDDDPKLLLHVLLERSFQGKAF